MGTIRNKNSWNTASKRLFGSYSHSVILEFHSRYSVLKSRTAEIYSGKFLFPIDPKRKRPNRYFLLKLQQASMTQPPPPPPCGVSYLSILGSRHEMPIFTTVNSLVTTVLFHNLYFFVFVMQQGGRLRERSLY